MAKQHQRVGRGAWARVYIPPQMLDILQHIAAKHGYHREAQLHRLIYDTLKQVYPDDIALLEQFDELSPDWLERAEQDAEDT